MPVGSVRFAPVALSLVLFALVAISSDRLCAQDTGRPKPTHVNVAYGTHPRQVLDVYQAQAQGGAQADQPAPLLFFVHGGGWMNGDKGNPDFLAQCLAAGVSVVSINYRLIPDVIEDKSVPAVKACLDDTSRALQFVRSQAAEWKIDPRRIAGCGGSAGGFNVLWLALHPDRAEPKSEDPVARQSTRLSCVLAFVPQTSLDPVQMRTWIPNNNYGHHAFALASYDDFVKQRKELSPWIEKFSPYALASSDDPPVYLYYDSVPAMGKEAKDPPHSANFGVGLAEKLKQVGVEYELNYPGAEGVKHPNLFSFLTDHLQHKMKTSK